jgi:hypothetical protein
VLQAIEAIICSNFVIICLKIKWVPKLEERIRRRKDKKKKSKTFSGVTAWAKKTRQNGCV